MDVLLLLVCLCVCVMQDSVIGEYLSSSSSPVNTNKHTSALLHALQSASRSCDTTTPASSPTAATAAATTDRPCTRAKRPARMFVHSSVPHRIIYNLQRYFFAILYLSQWPSFDPRAKFYGYRPRGTPPLGALT